MYINTFRYTAEAVSCKLCTEYERGCTASGCPWMEERIEAGVVGYADTVVSIFGEHPALHWRLIPLLRLWQGTLWQDDDHCMRMDWLKCRIGYSRKRDTPAYYAAMYLLTSGEDIYRRTADCFCVHGFDPGRACLRGIDAHGYTLYMAARSLYSGVGGIEIADLADPEIIDPAAFRLIVNATLIARYGLAAFKLRRRTEMEFDTKHIRGNKLVSRERYLDITRHMIEFSILVPYSPYGEMGDKIRLFLSEDDYAEALERQRKKQIKIKRHAYVIEGNLVYDNKKKKPRRHKL